jgi:(p)ppGpp synthase/HD superfamily hydrolase
MATNLIERAKEYATKLHAETNHTYDGKPYTTHLYLVFSYAEKYIHLVSSEVAESVLASAWTHDTIEDCRVTYNDVKSELGTTVAEITYALTNEKGKNRKERANAKYYKGIRETPYATFIKLCDRLANVSYSKSVNSKMIEAYQKEQGGFECQLRYYDEFEACDDDMYAVMWAELNEMLNN